MSHQPNDNNNHADADETYLRIDEPVINVALECYEIRETNERNELINTHTFKTSEEAHAFVAGYELAGEHNLEEYDRLVRQYNRLAAQSGLIERYLNIAEEIGHDAETIIATIRKITA